MSPEYAMGGLFSVKSDVYSFGVLILEIVSSSRNSSFHLTMDSPSLLAYVSKSCFMSPPKVILCSFLKEMVTFGLSMFSDQIPN